MAENNKNSFDTTVASLFKGMDSFISAKTVVGEAVYVMFHLALVPELLQVIKRIMQVES